MTTIVKRGINGKPTIQLFWKEKELHPWHLVLHEGEYYLIVNSDKFEKVTLIKWPPVDQHIIESETNKEMGPIQLGGGIKIVVYIGDEKADLTRRANSMIEGDDTSKYVNCYGCIQVCAVPCPPGYYYAGPVGQCDIGLTMMCCCKTP